MLYLLDYGAGNVASLANSLTSLGHSFKWVTKPSDIQLATKIIFPGVGSFDSALASLNKKGFAQPLRDYINQGKPYMGICIGMQALFQESEESTTQKGLGIINAKVAKFDNSNKAVPSMGWNGAALVREQGAGETFGTEGDTSYYFVHSYRVDYNQEGVKDWALTVTNYGGETYVSSVQRGNVFATQFHPEKSGKAGLEVLRRWLESDGVIPVEGRGPLRREEEVKKRMSDFGFTKRIVACLDVRANDQGDLVVTKGDQYDVREDSATTTASTSTDPSTTRQVRNLGKPVDLARRYFLEGADEIAFLNITSFRSCPLHDQPMLDVVRQSAETVFVPLTIGGGIRDTTDPDGTSRSALEVAGTYFRCGADKVSIGSDAVFAVEELLANEGRKTGKTGIETISYGYGAQAVVVSIDPKRVYANSLSEVPLSHRPTAVDLSEGVLLPGSSVPLPADLGPNGERYCWYQCTVKGGRELRDVDVVQLAQGVEALGAGEILLNSVDRDGSKAGFDLRLVSLVRRAVRIPVVASSGAGKWEDFQQVFEATDAEAALAAGIFHRREVPIESVKEGLRGKGVGVRRDLV
ncbi:Imidazoleglycerol phosphate synthase [Meredithblackwellia eburnea MCA 4105]